MSQSGLTIQKKLPLVAVVGPTAAGKSALAVALALRHNGEVVSADSMQVYRHMDIGTAKPTLAEMRGVPHHLIDCVEPGESFSVADYVARARQAVAAVAGRGRLPILVGGTGLYVNSLVDNVEFSPIPQSPALRSELRELAGRRGGEYLVEQLAGFDPEYAKKLHPNNLGRVIRAIEVYRLTGVTMTEYNRRSKLLPSPYETCFIGLTTSDRQLLYDRINHRVDAMMEAGLVREAEALRGMGLSQTAVQAIGYKELEGYFQRGEPLADCVERIKQETRRYAKRQLTWFRRDGRIAWIETDRCNSPEEVMERAEKIMAAHIRL